MKITCNFCCLQCEEKASFVKHLKTEHLLREGHDVLKCPFGECESEYLTFRSLNKHIDVCSQLNNKKQINKNQILEPLSQDNHLNQNVNTINSFFEPPEILEQSLTDTFSSFRIGSTFSKFETINENKFEYKVDKSEKNICTFLETFASNINQLELSNSKKNSLYQITEELIKNVHLFFMEFLKNHSDTPIDEALRVSTDFVLNKVRELNSDYKRKKFVESQADFVKPEEVCIGVKWKTKIQNNIPIMGQVRDTFHYVPILQKLKTIFSNQVIRETYFEFQKLRRERCVNGIFKEFCCGQIYKKNELFKEFPESLQIQIFVDGFDPCDALKSKANKHSQIAVYFSILNMPPKWTYNLDNIHLVALCNAKILKSPDVGYNDIWNKVVQEISALETDGIILNDGFVLKGT